jgi:hypothetical protein
VSRLGLRTGVRLLPTPHADLVSARECDFAETLAALHELVGRRVAVYLLGGMFVEARCTPAAFSGTLARGYELGGRNDAPLCFEVGDAGSLLVASQTLGCAWREEYERASDGVRWRLVALHFRGGACLEVEELV